MRSLLLLLLLLLVVGAVACEPAAPPPSRTPAPALVGEPGRDEDLSFVRSEKLAEDVQELVVRAYGADVVFTFEVETRRPLDAVTRARFAERGVVLEDTDAGLRARASVPLLGVITGDERVRAVRCAPAPLPEVAPPAEDVWRRKLTREVRIVLAARSACWFEVRVAYEPASPDAARAERAFLESHGGIVVGGGDGELVAWVPVLLLPHLAARDAVLAVEPRVRAR